MISFSLNKPVSYEKICQEIDKLIKKHVKSEQQANSTLLVIRLVEVNSDSRVNIELK